MILLSGNSINSVVLTLNENNYYTGSTTWIFSLTNIDSKQNKTFIANDISASPCRYNKFNITVSGSGENLSAGTINITDLGNYKYEVYASDTITLDTTNKPLIESGIMFLTGATSTNVVYVDNNDNTRVIYQN